MLTNLVGSVVDHAVDVWCDILLLEAFQLSFPTKGQKIVEPLLSLRCINAEPGTYDFCSLTYLCVNLICLRHIRA